MLYWDDVCVRGVLLECGRRIIECMLYEYQYWDDVCVRGVLLECGLGIGMMYVYGEFCWNVDGGSQMY